MQPFRKASLVVGQVYHGNKMFDLNDAYVNRDDCLYPYFRLKSLFAERGVDLSTCDINKPSESDFVLHLDMPDKPPGPSEAERAYLLALESPLIHPSNFERGLHARFRKVFTWDDRLADGGKYVKVNYSFRFPEVPARSSFAEAKPFCLIAANKKSSFPGELYSKRMEIIRWFQARHPDQFDLYGFGWDRYYFHGPLTRKLNRLGRLTRALMPPMPSYRGKVASKTQVMGKYRFAFALENITGVPGYITEKIFDCFFAGCVPIYLGAPNILEYVPKDAFIDMRDYQGLEALHSALAGMTAEEWLARRQAIRVYLGSEKALQFSADRFARTVVDSVLEQSHG